MFSPWLLVGALVSMIAVGGGAYFKGDADAAHRYQAKIATLQAEAVEAAQKQRQAELIQSSNASAGFENDSAKAKIVYRTITQQVDRIVDRPVYSNVCLDGDGLQLANAALSGIPTSAPSGEPNSTMSRPNATH